MHRKNTDLCLFFITVSQQACDRRTVLYSPKIKPPTPPTSSVFNSGWDLCFSCKRKVVFLDSCHVRLERGKVMNGIQRSRPWHDHFPFRTWWPKGDQDSPRVAVCRDQVLDFIVKYPPLIIPLALFLPLAPISTAWRGQQRDSKVHFYSCIFIYTSNFLFYVNLHVSI